LYNLILKLWSEGRTFKPVHFLTNNKKWVQHNEVSWTRNPFWQSKEAFFEYLLWKPGNISDTD